MSNMENKGGVTLKSAVEEGREERRRKIIEVTSYWSITTLLVYTFKSTCLTELAACLFKTRSMVDEMSVSS